MDWDAAMEEDRRVLKRIVALLYAFAGLAERFCALPRPVRGFVLWILHFAETVARDFVMDTALEHGASMAPAVFLIPALHGGDSPADALRLAENFRALAVLLDRLADGNPGRRRINITKLLIALVSAARIHLPAGTHLEPRQICLATSGSASARRDSS